MGRSVHRGSVARSRIAAGLMLALLPLGGEALAQTERHAPSAAEVSAAVPPPGIPARGFVERLRDDPWEFTVAPYLWLTTV
ncbi:hypothetical protein KGQ64_12150, partial [bacterium]|nr:hypothetical protein [bacterium]